MKTKLYKLFTLLFISNTYLSVAQLASDLDPTFGTNGVVVDDIAGADDWVYSLAIQPDGKIIAVGITNSGDMAVARYSSTGVLDVTFGTSGYQIISATTASVDDADVALQSDGKIIIGGRFRNGTNMDFAVVRLTANGAMDITFGTSGMTTVDLGANNEKASSMALQPDGKIILAGVTHNGSDSDFGMIRLNSNGSLDNTFGTNGILINDLGNGNGDGIESIVLQPDGKIIAVGFIYNDPIDADFGIVRYNSDGTLDNTFGTSGVTAVDYNSRANYPESVTLQTDGKIVVTGQYDGVSDDDFMTVRLNATGTIDNTFGTTGVQVTDLGATERAWDVVIQHTGKIIIVGEEGNSAGVLRYNTDGSLDNSFGTGGNQVLNVTPGNYDKARTVVIQNDGKILIGGNTYNSNNDFVLARFYGDDPGTANVEILNNSSIFNAYPNPFSNQLTVEFDADNSSDKHLVLYDLAGKMILKQTTQESTTTIYTEQLKTGTYLLKCRTENSEKTIKIIK